MVLLKIYLNVVVFELLFEKTILLITLSKMSIEVELQPKTRKTLAFVKNVAISDITSNLRNTDH